MCKYSTLPHDKLEYLTWQYMAWQGQCLKEIFRQNKQDFQIYVKSLNFKTSFGISNKIKWIFKR
jgi:hypothetical protein